MKTHLPSSLTLHSSVQMGIKMHKLGERCDLFQEGGQVTDPAIDKRMDFHFNAILDVVSEWRKDKSQNQDTPLRGSKTPVAAACHQLYEIFDLLVEKCLPPQKKSRR